jgi:hypothetical protein
LSRPRSRKKPRRFRRFLKIYLIINLGLLIFAAAADRIWFQGSGHPPPHLRIPGLFQPAAPIPGTVALLVNGAIRPGKNHPRYWNNLSLMYGTLRHLGFETIHVLNSDGTSPAPDRLKRAFLAFFPYGDTEDSPRDLDLDGHEDIDGPATRECFEATLSGIGSRLRSEDRLFLFFTDHGKLRFKHGRFYAVVRLWGDEISGNELDGLLRRALPADTWVTVLATQCWGETFLKAVKRPRTVLMAPGRPNWIWSDHDYSVFPFLFCKALLQRSPKTGEAVPVDPGRDGYLSLREAFEIARGWDHAPEWPIMWINRDGSPLPFPF